ncbi:MAG TPA: TIGR02530 family flagellar biosynthesis protein [bacterium]|nr:TIGR02530 family flagellar biosynthesis protein [bacterium]
MSRVASVVGSSGVAGRSAVGRTDAASQRGDFAKVLGDLGGTAGIKFSKHAVERMSARGISFDRTSIDKLDAAISAAKSKGANESLVLMDELALVVSVKNRTVITAMSSREPDHNVFTSIDSAVIA